MTKEEVLPIFIQWLKDQGVYDEFVSNLSEYCSETLVEHIYDTDVSCPDLIISAFRFDLNGTEHIRRWFYLHTAWQKHYSQLTDPSL